MVTKPPTDKRFEHGEIVYWCHQKGHEYSVHYGRVDEQYQSQVYIDYLEPVDKRVIYSEYIDEFKNGVPISEFKTDTRLYKLPKGWSYNTKFYQIETERSDEEIKVLKSCDIRNAENIKHLYENGFLVKTIKNNKGYIETEISKDGWRLVEKHPAIWSDRYKVNNVSVYCEKVYRTYEEAKQEVDEHIAEFKRQAELSDYDWSLEQIDKTLNHWKTLYGISDQEFNQVRNYLVSLENLEDIEVKISNGSIVWKYWKKKRWNGIETNM